VSVFELIDLRRGPATRWRCYVGCSGCPRAVTTPGEVDRLPGRTQQDALLTQKIREIHSRSRETYGYPRVHAELPSLGIGCARRRVARLMKAAGLRGCTRGRKRRTTRRDSQAAPAPDLLRRNFVTCQPNKVWLAHITYVPYARRGLPLPGLHSRHSFSQDRRVVDGLSHENRARGRCFMEMAVWRRGPLAGLVHHSDRGVQYTAISFGKRLEEVGIIPSMGRTGTALDNALWRRASSPP